MSYSDNMENTLKNLEGRDPRDSLYGTGDRARRELEGARRLAAAPFAEKLRVGRFTAGLLAETARLGHGLRTKVRLAWLDTTLRLEAREYRLELRPTPEGVVAYFSVGGKETGHEPVDLNGRPAGLAKRWMQQVGPRPADRPETLD